MKKIVFLQPNSTVIPTEDRDYPEWHLGRERYALWYIEVDDPILISYLTQLREQFSDLLYQSNQRQFHITLFVAGFWVEQAIHSDDFVRAQLTQQLEHLKNLKLESFQLKMGALNSFESALFLKVDDTAGVLDKIRKTLLHTSQEVAALSYCPHITLGLYREAVSSDHVLTRMAEIEDINYSLNISKLTFGFYQADVLQGPLFSHTQIKLGNAQCN
ncbi:2'-5' RNA ligase family protein [Acinetobacter sp. WCHA55]|uniref:2'-5' RNA ligase family protein n=1 Tax=Acinetobacter sp. WCHA55 TaxID=2004646 RepID=UPI000B3C6A1A|nr:2'-5' RNA ligase family protein [Acinetobacter sp. WCHA55]AYA68362.1 2'-5' RNA ligase family protein [Acinetobacter sp. WCHA55]